MTLSDLDELERMLAASGAGSAGDLQKAKTLSPGLGLFGSAEVDELIGVLDAIRATALAA